MKIVPPEDDGPRVSHPGALSRDELIALVEKILRADGTEAEHHELVRRFEHSVPHPRATDLIYWPE
ncbi:bacteriocin immunity protein [Solirubrobacter pauli]|uniref:bacteriocin immunity protein n=1 Tax=Solirubrobacter pauli TaxID=166793 RepID=UPI001B85FF65|nr:bacteriocin immunity protein [Solirubrobacter pauli]